MLSIDSGGKLCIAKIRFQHVSTTWRRNSSIHNSSPWEAPVNVLACLSCLEMFVGALVQQVTKGQFKTPSGNLT